MNRIGDDGAKAIAAALILNENLKMKDLEFCIIKIIITNPISHNFLDISNNLSRIMANIFNNLLKILDFYQILIVNSQ